MSVNNHDVMDLTLHGGGQGFESPRLHFRKTEILQEKREAKMSARTCSLGLLIRRSQVRIPGWRATKTVVCG
jgi:hypothetical protein